jgi:hypothetical protein
MVFFESVIDIPQGVGGKSRRVVSTGASGRLDSLIWPYGVKVAPD